MKRVATITLVIVGIALAALAFNAYDQASDDADMAASICGLGSSIDCDTAMDWTTPGLYAVGAVIAFGAVWLINRSPQTKRTEDLVG